MLLACKASGSAHTIKHTTNQDDSTSQKDAMETKKKDEGDVDDEGEGDPSPLVFTYVRAVSSPEPLT